MKIAKKSHSAIMLYSLLGLRPSFQLIYLATRREGGGFFVEIPAGPMRTSVQTRGMKFVCMVLSFSISLMTILYRKAVAAARYTSHVGQPSRTPMQHPSSSCRPCETPISTGSPLSHRR